MLQATGSLRTSPLICNEISRPEFPALPSDPVTGVAVVSGGTTTLTPATHGSYPSGSRRANPGSVIGLRFRYVMEA